MTYYGEEGYLQLMSQVSHAPFRMDRTGTGTHSFPFPDRLKFNLRDHTFPLFTTKKMAWKSIRAETLWFVQGRTDLASLREDGCKWWDPWALKDDTVGRAYGAQLRHWKRPDGTEVDQIRDLVREIQHNPTSRRHVMTMWNPGELEQMALPPCHGVLIQFWVDAQTRELDSFVHIRSSDMFLGLPTNIAGYAMLTYIIGSMTGYSPRELTVSLGDAHVYANHVDAVREQVKRSPLKPPKLEIVYHKDIDDLKVDDFILSDYEHMPSIKASISV